MVQRKKIIYRLIYFLPAGALLFFILLGIRYERTLLRAAELKPIVVGADNVTAKLYRLRSEPAPPVSPARDALRRDAAQVVKQGKADIRQSKATRQPALPTTKTYLLVLSETDGRRVEGYFLDLAKKRLGYANFSASTYTPVGNSWAILDRVVLNEFKAADELAADFQNLPQGIMITVKGPGEMALTLDADAEQQYKKRLICQRTILLESR